MKLGIGRALYLLSREKAKTDVFIEICHNIRIVLSRQVDKDRFNTYFYKKLMRNVIYSHCLGLKMFVKINIFLQVIHRVNGFVNVKICLILLNSTLYLFKNSIGIMKFSILLV